MSYGKNIPVDRAGTPLHGSPPSTTALGSLYRDNASASSVTTLTDNTTIIEVVAKGFPAFVRWADDQATSISATAFDHVVPIDESRLLVVPKKTAGTGSQSVASLSYELGLYHNVATFTPGNGSVMLVQY